MVSLYSYIYRVSNSACSTYEVRCLHDANCEFRVKWCMHNVNSTSSRCGATYWKLIVAIPHGVPNPLKKGRWSRCSLPQEGNTNVKSTNYSNEALAKTVMENSTYSGNPSSTQVQIVLEPYTMGPI